MSLENKPISATEEQLQLSFYFSPIGMALVGLDGKWLKVNKILCQMLGYEEQELLKTDFQQITHPGDLGSDLQKMEGLLNGAVFSYQMEKRYLHKEGGIIWVNLDVSLVCNNAGKPDFFISQIQDITERKKVKEELNKRDYILKQISARVPV